MDAGGRAPSIRSGPCRAVPRLFGPGSPAGTRITTCFRTVCLHAVQFPFPTDFFGSSKSPSCGVYPWCSPLVLRGDVGTESATCAVRPTSRFPRGAGLGTPSSRADSLRRPEKERSGVVERADVDVMILAARACRPAMVERSTCFNRFIVSTVWS